MTKLFWECIYMYCMPKKKQIGHEKASLCCRRNLSWVSNVCEAPNGLNKLQDKTKDYIFRWSFSFILLRLVYIKWSIAYHFTFFQVPVSCYIYSYLFWPFLVQSVTEMVIVGWARKLRTIVCAARHSIRFFCQVVNTQGSLCFSTSQVFFSRLPCL